MAEKATDLENQIAKEIENKMAKEKEIEQLDSLRDSVDPNVQKGMDTTIAEKNTEKSAIQKKIQKYEKDLAMVRETQSAMAKNAEVAKGTAKTVGSSPREPGVPMTPESMREAEQAKVFMLEQQLVNSGKAGSIDVKFSKVKILHSSAADLLSLLKQSPNMVTELKSVDPPSAAK